MSASEIETHCVAITKAGSQCKNLATTGSDYCHIHRPVTISAADGRPPTGPLPNGAISDERLRQQLMTELDNLIRRVKALSPEYETPEFTHRRMVDLADEQADSMAPDVSLGILERLRSAVNKDLLDAETWKGMWYMVNYTLEYQSDIVRRRFKGDYETDGWGLDWEFLEAVRPFLDFMYKLYWRVETTGIENIPDYDRALLVSNHSGQLPWDGAMIMTAILNEHPAQRLVRNLYANWFPSLPFLSAALVKMGQALASVENGTRLLEQDELVGVFPEGYKGVGKLFKDRYKLARFGRGGFVKMALKTQAPIIPVSVVGAEETYISLAKSPTLARLTGFPYFPISPRFPWLGPLGAIPWPTKWYIDFGEPISLDAHGPDAADDVVLVSQLTDQVRNIVQEMIGFRLSQRRSVIY
ncbi:MAG TPA: lysophospholipid acyltransferase family protein [Anaerolineae bacterium]|jgi:1-acyl-sn-glycerol-3-phosphate acyltransferase|nr:lysophospholipid acyltransferase family protein [Anaerolineae bacterium]